MSYFSIDVEADGPCPGLYSMISFGAVLIDADGNFDKTFYGKIKPISDEWIADALAVSGLTREETMTFSDPKDVIKNFYTWIVENSKDRPIFISDNNGFDWQFINYYFWRYMHKNPFGHSSRNLNDLYKGTVKNMRKNFKHLRKTKHTHHPVDDAKGNAEAFLRIKTYFDHANTIQKN